MGTGAAGEIRGRENPVRMRIAQYRGSGRTANSGNRDRYLQRCIRRRTDRADSADRAADRPPTAPPRPGSRRPARTAPPRPAPDRAAPALDRPRLGPSPASDRAALADPALADPDPADRANPAPDRAALAAPDLAAPTSPMPP